MKLLVEAVSGSAWPLTITTTIAVVAVCLVVLWRLNP